MGQKLLRPPSLYIHISLTAAKREENGLYEGKYGGVDQGLPAVWPQMSY